MALTWTCSYCNADSTKQRLTHVDIGWNYKFGQGYGAAVCPDCNNAGADTERLLSNAPTYPADSQGRRLHEKAADVPESRATLHHPEGERHVDRS